VSASERHGTLLALTRQSCQLPFHRPSMPELPEVETVKRSLTDRVVGRHIHALTVGDFPGVLGGDRQIEVAARITGRTIEGIRRRAKYLILDLDDGTAIVVHLRMTGRLNAVPHEEPPLRFQRLSIQLDDGVDLRFSDQRKFGRVVHMHGADLHRLEARLGMEPLTRDFSAAWLADRLRRRQGKIKSVLLDQDFIGGLGNIYADESLFRAGVHPERRANSLSSDEVRRLHRAIRAVLRSAIDGRGTTFSSFADADGNRGGYGGRLLVYGRGGKALCPRCGAPLERTTVGGRGTSFCPRCQPIDSRMGPTEAGSLEPGPDETKDSTR
jgi:formamidopyrimidine-DNA glycosylase